MNSKSSIAGRSWRYALVRASITVRLGPCVRCASRAPARGTGRLAPTSTHSPSRRSCAMNAAMTSLGAASISVLAEREEPAQADPLEVGGMVRGLDEVVAEVGVQLRTVVALQQLPASAARPPLAWRCPRCPRQLPRSPVHFPMITEDSQRP